MSPFDWSHNIHTLDCFGYWSIAFTFITMDSKHKITNIRTQTATEIGCFYIMQRPLRIYMRQAVAWLVMATFQTFVQKEYNKYILTRLFISFENHILCITNHLATLAQKLGIGETGNYFQLLNGFGCATFYSEQYNINKTAKWCFLKKYWIVLTYLVHISPNSKFKNRISIST